MPLTHLHTRKCKGCGHVQGPEAGHECESCGRDDKWQFFCEEHAKMFITPVCDFCEQAALQREKEEQAYREEQERRRRAAEALEHKRREFEKELRRQREEAALRDKQFTQVARIPAYIALAATFVCVGVTGQLVTHGTFIMPHSLTVLISSLGVGIVSALSIFVLAAFFDW